jgi:hypothetical protein
MISDPEPLFPEGISDQTASLVSDFLWRLISAWDEHYSVQLHRYYESRRPPYDPDQPWKTLPPDR